MVFKCFIVFSAGFVVCLPCAIIFSDLRRGKVRNNEEPFGGLQAAWSLKGMKKKTKKCMTPQTLN